MDGRLRAGQEITVSERTLLGQVLLPPGNGSRGVEVIALIQFNGKPRQQWILFDDDGHFTHTFRGDLKSLTVHAGIDATLRKYEKSTLPQTDDDRRVDFGIIDLRHLVQAHQLKLQSHGKAGEVRIAMWSGPPTAGVALGSRQFPTRIIGQSVDWLVPPDQKAIYFLVERPLDSGRESAWRTGEQTLFGPYSNSDLPAELVID